MSTWLIVLLSIIGFIGFIILIRRITRKSRLEREELNHQKFLKRISQWEVDDELILYTYDQHHLYKDKGAMYRTAERNLLSPRKWSEASVKLKKWSEEEVIYETENGQQFYGDYQCIDYNRSANNRQRNSKMDTFMESLDDKAKFREDRLSKLLDKDKKKEEDN